LWLHHAVTTSKQGEELGLIVIDRAGTAKMAQLTKRVAACWRTKPLINKFAELRPRRVAPIVVQAVAFEAVIPLLGNTFHVEGGQSHLFYLGRPCGAKELIATVKPWQGIPGSIVLWKTQLMRRCVKDCAADGGSRSITGGRPRSRDGFYVLGLDSVDSNMESTLISLYSSNLAIHREHLRGDGFHAILHGDHLPFEYDNLAQHILKELLDVMEG
jgi:hypothetical protein